jgi:hypothetical protein
MSDQLLELKQIQVLVGFTFLFMLFTFALTFAAANRAYKAAKSSSELKAELRELKAFLQGQHSTKAT